MSNKTDYDFSVDKEKKKIIVKRTFAAELPLVWDAYTKSEILDQWWAPKPWKTKTKSMDFREGGRWIYAMVGPKGEEHWCVANYDLIQFQKKFRGKDGFSDSEGNVNKEMPESTWEVTFTSKGDRTAVELNISYPDLAQLEATIQMGFREGLAMGMENLDELLATGIKA